METKNKVLIVTNTLNRGGGAKYVYQLIEVLFELKFDVHLITYERSTIDEQVSTKIKYNCLNINYIDLNRGIARAIRRLKWIINLRREIKNIDYDFSFVITSDIIMDFSLAKFLYLKNDIAIEIGNPYHLKPLRKFFYFKFIKRYKKLVVLNNALKTKLYKSLKTRTIGLLPGYYVNSLETKNYTPIKYRMISTGRLIQSKRFDFLISLISELRFVIPEIKLHIFGDGPSKSLLEAQIMELDLKENVFLEGESSDIERELAKSEIFIFSSESEGFCYSILEATSLGLPVISSKFQYGYEQLVKDGYNGYTYSYDEKERITAIILDLYSDEILMRLLSQNSIKISKRFSFEKFKLNLTSILSNM
jgi:glycosyltransferase involved in cell wall biosynthesis